MARSRSPYGRQRPVIEFPGRRKRAKRPTPSTHDAFASVLFADTIAARMLRMLEWAKGGMTQAYFMQRYHEMCDRERPSRSSFLANFGRYVAEHRRPATQTTPDLSHARDLMEAYAIKAPCIIVRAKSHGKDCGKKTEWGGPWGGSYCHPPICSATNMLYWEGRLFDLTMVSNECLQASYESMERQATAPWDSPKNAPHITSYAEEWLLRLRAEIARRDTSPSPPTVVCRECSLASSSPDTPPCAARGHDDGH